MGQSIERLIRALDESESDLYGRDPLLTWELLDADLGALLQAAEIFERLWMENIDARLFRSGLAVSLFRDQSTRTRFSFASAASLLGLTLMDLDETKSQIAHGETVRETANMISFLAEVIGIRDDMFIGHGHEYMQEVAQAVASGFEEGVLPQRPVIVNLQCDRDHPTQSLADLMHLCDTFGSLESLQGKKVAMSWAYSPSYGKPLSVPQGIIGLLTRFGMEVVLAHPEGYDLMPEVVSLAQRQAEASGGSFEISHDMEQAFAGADVVYPKSWAPLAVMEARTRYLRSGQLDRMAELEREAIESNSAHTEWQCTEELMARTRGGEALYMHCLPADISGVSCRQGEVAASVFDRYRVATYRQAGHKPFIVAAMILMARFRAPARALQQRLEEGGQRHVVR